MLRDKIIDFGLKQTTTTTVSRTPPKIKGIMHCNSLYLHVHCNSLYISSPSSAKQQREMTKSSVRQRLVFFVFWYGIKRWNYIFSLKTFSSHGCTRQLRNSKVKMRRRSHFLSQFLMSALNKKGGLLTSGFE